MGALSPWQMLLWIVLAEFLTAPILAYMATWIMNVYFSKKLEHNTIMMKRIIEIAGEIMKQWNEKKDEKT